MYEVHTPTESVGARDSSLLPNHAMRALGDGPRQPRGQSLTLARTTSLAYHSSRPASLENALQLADMGGRGPWRRGGSRAVLTACPSGRGAPSYRRAELQGLEQFVAPRLLSSLQRKLPSIITFRVPSPLACHLLSGTLAVFPCRLASCVPNRRSGHQRDTFLFRAGEHDLTDRDSRYHVLAHTSPGLLRRPVWGWSGLDQPPAENASRKHPVRDGGRAVHLRRPVGTAA